jgi:hypothetical protein
MTTKTLYKVIGFGTNEHGFFNQFACSSSIGYACGFYNAHLQDPEMDGAVMIRCQHEDWEIIQEFCSESYPYSVECSPLFVHRINRSPELVLV